MCYGRMQNESNIYILASSCNDLPNNSFNDNIEMPILVSDKMYFQLIYGICT